ncbi:MAG: basic amino acid ABC transporter substrate-binding protein [Hespellia sp.]|nr:basic amino acid ABC transporter substrate-binding protein [Hespellia sp.]
MKMKKILSVVLVAACTISMAACGSNASKSNGSDNSSSDSSDTLVMATNAEFPPYEYYDGDEIVGIDAEFAAAIADKLGMKLKIEDMAFDSIIPAVQGGKADFGAAGITVTDERKTQVDFSDSYYTGRQVIIVTEDSTIASPDDLEGKKMGVQLGTTGDLYVSGDYGDENVERFNKGFEAVQSLLQGKIDAVVIDDQPAKAFVAENDGLKILDTEYIEEEYAFCFKKDSKLVDQVNEAIASLQADGTFDKIVAKYITAE